MGRPFVADKVIVCVCAPAAIADTKKINKWIAVDFFTMFLVEEKAWWCESVHLLRLRCAFFGHPAKTGC